MSVQLISEMLLEREIKRLEDLGRPKEQEIIYCMCKKELAVLSKLKVTVDMRGEIEECNQRIANQAIYFMDPKEFNAMAEKAIKYNEIANFVNGK